MCITFSLSLTMTKSRLSVKMYVSYSTVTHLTYISWCLLHSDSVLMQCGGHVRSKPEDYYASQKSFRYADYHIYISIRLQMFYMETSSKMRIYLPFFLHSIKCTSKLFKRIYKGYMWEIKCWLNPWTHLVRSTCMWCIEECNTIIPTIIIHMTEHGLISR